MSLSFNPIGLNELISLFAILLLLFFSALISASEVALFSLSPSQIKSVADKKDSRNRIVLKLIKSPKKLLATILIGNNLVNVGIVILSTYVSHAIINFGNNDLLVFLFNVIIITSFLLLFGEILPKLYASKNNLSISLLMAYPLNFLQKIFSPLSFLLIYSTTRLNKRFETNKSNFSIDDISHALDLTNSNELIEDKQILKGIVNFGNIDVKEIMKSRVDVVSADITFGLNKLISIIVESGYSRIPVYLNSFDNIKGVLYIKDLLAHLHKGESFKWQSLIRPAYYVPESKKINDLLEEFQQRKIHLAIVIDEFGGSSGIITLEDILEEIVGEITDEYDEDDELFTKIDDKNYIFEGKILLNDFCKILNLTDDFFEFDKGDSDTLAGLILELTGEIPEKNKNIFYKNFEFKIKSADKRKIKQIALKIIEL
jgi:putative hemolysin